MSCDNVIFKARVEHVLGMAITTIDTLADSFGSVDATEIHQMNGPPIESEQASTSVLGKRKAEDSQEPEPDTEQQVPIKAEIGE